MLRKSGVATKRKSKKTKRHLIQFYHRQLRVRLKSEHLIRYYHRQLRRRLKSELHNELFRKDKGKEPGADLRTVVLSRRTATIYQLFR